VGIIVDTTHSLLSIFTDDDKMLIRLSENLGDEETRREKKNGKAECSRLVTALANLWLSTNWKAKALPTCRRPCHLQRQSHCGGAVRSKQQMLSVWLFEIVEERSEFARWNLEFLKSATVLLVCGHLSRPRIYKIDTKWPQHRQAYCL
jgi:hypothetical protein